MDYLLKPIEKDRLAMTIERARRAIQEKTAEAGTRPNAGRAAARPQRTKLLVRAGNRNFIVDAQDVVYATIDDGLITLVTTTLEGQSNYRTIEELQSNLDPRHVLARAPLLPGQHQPDQGSHAVVQVQLSAPHGRQEADRNPGEPRADQAPARAAEAVTHQAF